MSTELKNRAKAFALRVLRLVDALPRSTKGRILSDQIGRSGTSVAANYRPAHNAAGAQALTHFGLRTSNFGLPHPTSIPSARRMMREP